MDRKRKEGCENGILGGGERSQARRKSEGMGGSLSLGANSLLAVFAKNTMAESSRQCYNRKHRGQILVLMYL